MERNNNIPKEILPYFIKILKRLWSGHAAVMIGVGFCKNEKKNDSLTKDFPDWNRLGDYYVGNIELPFFNYYLKGKGELDLPEESVFETGSNTWKKYDSWPLKKLRVNLLRRGNEGEVGN